MCLNEITEEKSDWFKKPFHRSNASLTQAINGWTNMSGIDHKGGLKIK